MTSHRITPLALIASMAVALATAAAAQTPPEQDETAPEAASSPHQRSATSTEAKEAPAASQTDPNPASASSPHQQRATEGKMASAKTGAERDRMMNDCMKKEAERNSALSADQVKKTCKDKMMKAHSDEAKQE
jgi:hypothetical protein